MKERKKRSTKNGVEGKQERERESNTEMRTPWPFALSIHCNRSHFKNQKIYLPSGAEIITQEGEVQTSPNY